MFLRDTKTTHIAQNLKEYRISHNLKQTEMADLLKMNYQNYSKMERGVYQPSLDKLLEICDILMLTPNDLLQEGRSFDEYKQEYIEKFDNELLQFLDIVHIIEEERAKADFAHATGNYKAESLSLDIIFHALVKTDDENINYRKMIDTLYYDYINSYIRKFSDKTHKELYQKIMSYPKMVVYNGAKKEVDSMMNYINRILVMSVNGEDPDSVEMSDVSCTGSCSTCGGCN